MLLIAFANHIIAICYSKRLTEAAANNYIDDNDRCNSMEVGAPFQPDIPYILEKLISMLKCGCGGGGFMESNHVNVF